MLRWACERAGFDIGALTHRIPQLTAWERGEKQPTLKQLEGFAKATHTPVGYLFLPEPPVERVPIPDFRTVANERIDHPSPDLLDTLYICQQRQEWYRDFARSMGEAPLALVGSVRVAADLVRTAALIRHALAFDIDERRQMPTWTDALRRFIEQADALGVLVMVSGVVGSNNRRKLDPQEFRGFALADDLAPLVFINGADTKAAQMFTLAHELVHVWLGQSALSDAQAASVPEHEVERWCNLVAAELLVPLEILRAEYDRRAELRAESDRLARRFKVSTLVILRRIHDAGGFSREAFWQAYEEELARLRALPKGSGGDFYLTLGARASKRFARALVVSTLEGRSSFTEAFRLLGFKKMATFRELGHSLGLGI
jgi:Zn-dependent peptidase ImmA (M78 family)